MCPSRHDREPPTAHVQGGVTSLTADFSRVLVVGTSPVNCVVVSKIVERCGLKPLSGSPEAAAKAVLALAPGVVVLDGADGDAHELIDALQAMRRATADTAPRIILLSSRNGSPASLGSPEIADAVVPKPIMPERLQPLIENFAAQVPARS
jgi:CheY-like chemotaxis protein